MYKKAFKIIGIAFSVLVLSVIILPYVWVEVNTLAYKNEFKDLYLQTYETPEDNHCINKDNYCKVFYKTGNKAKIFYATNTSTFMCYFERMSADDAWKIYDADVLYSRSGSASDLSFPFYPIKDPRAYMADYTKYDELLYG